MTNPRFGLTFFDPKPIHRICTEALPSCQWFFFSFFFFFFNWKGSHVKSTNQKDADSFFPWKSTGHLTFEVAAVHALGFLRQHLCVLLLDLGRAHPRALRALSSESVFDTVRPENSPGNVDG